MANWTSASLGTVSVSSTRVVWEPPTRPGPIDVALMAGGAVGYLGYLRVRTDANNQIRLRTHAMQTGGSPNEAGPDLVSEFETAGLLTIVAGSLTKTFHIANATMVDTAEPYEWEFPDSEGVDAWVTAFVALPSATRNSATLTLAFNEAPTFTDSTGDAQSWTLNTAITDITVPEAAGEPAPTYAVVGSLPAGLALDTTTRVISGTPTEAGSGTITVRATNSEGMADWTVAYTINGPPTVTASGTPTTINGSEVVTLTGSATDPNNDTLTILWTSDGGGTFANDSAASTTWTAPATTTNQQNITLTLTATDPAGLSDTATVAVTVRANQAPTVTASATPTTVESGGQVALTATATDPESQTITPLWVSAGGGTFQDTAALNTTWVAPPVTVETTFNLSVAATDSLGSQGSASVAMTVQPSTLALSDFPQSDRQFDVLARIETADPGDIFSAPPRTVQGSLLEGEVGMGSDDTVITRIRILNSGTRVVVNDSNTDVDGNAATLSLSDYFDDGGAGNDLTLSIQTSEDTVADLTVENLFDSATSDALRLNVPPSAEFTLRAIESGHIVNVALWRTVPDVAPSFTDDTGDAQTWTTGTAITSITVPAASGNPTPTYAVEGSLPAGIAFDTTTRVISGTPTATSSGTITIRAANSEGHADWTVEYTTSAALVSPSFTDDTGDAQTWTVNTAITNITVPAASGNPTPTYAVEGSLPAGIAFNTTTRVLSGTPTGVGSGTITIRASNSEGHADWTVEYTTSAALVAPSFADSTGNDQSWTVNTAIANITVPEAAGEPAPTYAVQGTLPAGLAFDTSSRVISGTPTTVGSGTITVRATNSEGMADWTVAYTTAAALAAPTFLDSTGDAQTWTVGTAITNVTVPTANGNPTPTYAVQGSLPSGLAFSTSTRVISGTPTATGSGTITIRASNSEGNADWTLAYTTNAALATPTIDSIAAQTGEVVRMLVTAGQTNRIYSRRGDNVGSISADSDILIESGNDVDRVQVNAGSNWVRIFASAGASVFGQGESGENADLYLATPYGTVSLIDVDVVQTDFGEWTTTADQSAILAQIQVGDLINVVLAGFITLTAPFFTDSTGDDQTWTAGTAITSITVPAASGNPTPTYAVEGSLPAGLAFSTSTRVISGNTYGCRYWHDNHPRQ